MNARLFIKRNSATILSFMAVAGVVATAVTTARATPKAIAALENERNNKGGKLTVVEKAKTAIPIYIPPIVTGTATIMCILGSNVLNQHSQASMVSAYALTNQAYQDYRQKVRDMYGEETDHKIIEAIAVDKAEHMHVTASYLCGDCDTSLEENSSKPVLWYEEYSKRFFEASLEQVLTAEYHVNRNYILRGYNVLNELYDFLGLEPTDFGNEMGWIPTDEGEYWIEFNHRKAQLEDGTVFYILEMPFEPRLDYDEYY